jgi:hydrogenase maturation protease
VEAQEASGEATALLETWKAASAGQQVIVVDATVTGSPPGSISRWDAHTTTISTRSTHPSTHALGVGEAVELARALGILPGKLLIYGIEGINFDIGGRPSPEVLRAVEQLAGRIAAEV